MARIVDRQKKRDALILAAASTFAEAGFSGATISDIATAAGVGKGTVYEYFESKEELFFAVFTWTNDEIGKRIRAQLNETCTAKKQLELLCEESALVIDEMSKTYSLNLDFWAACRGSIFEGRFKNALEALYDEYRLLIAAVIIRGQESGEFARDLDADRLAAVIVGAFDGLGIQFWIGKTINLHKCALSFAKVLVQGMATPKP